MLRRRPQITVKLLILFGLMGFTALMIEGGLRIRSFFGPKSFNQHVACCEYDPLLGWRHVPNRIAKIVTCDCEVLERFNSRGVRGPEYPIEKNDGEYRIVILGDSFAEGYCVEFEELFSEVMKRRLIERARRQVEVINLGVAGYSTDQELLLFQTEGKLYRPDLTILMFHDNDVWSNRQAFYPSWGRGHKPLFQLEMGELHLTNVPIRSPDDPADLPPVDPSPVEVALLKRIKGTMADHSHLYGFVRERIKNTASFYSVAIKLGIADPPEPDDTITVPKEYGVYRRLDTPEVEAAWQLTAALLAKLEQETSAIGSELLVFYVPMVAVVYASEWDRMRRNYGLDDEDWNIERVERQLSELSERLGIELLDPLESMRANAPAQGGEHLYFELDRHWNRVGHRWVGQMLADYVEAHYPGATTSP